MSLFDLIRYHEPIHLYQIMNDTKEQFLKLLKSRLEEYG